MMFGEIENKPHVFGAYNEHIAQMCAQAPDRLYAVMAPSYWDPDAADESVARCVEMGAED